MSFWIIRKSVSSIHVLKMAKSEHSATEDQNDRSFLRESHFFVVVIIHLQKKWYDICIFESICIFPSSICSLHMIEETGNFNSREMRGLRAVDYV